jgi:hypothetical protein
VREEVLHLAGFAAATTKYTLVQPGRKDHRASESSDSLNSRKKSDSLRLITMGVSCLYFQECHINFVEG